MEEENVDIAIIGSGPAGQKAAVQASKLGKKVVIIEKGQDPGGACLFSGTIPSKTFREAVIDLTRFYERKFFGFDRSDTPVKIKDLQKRLNQVIEDEKSMLYRQFRRNQIRLIQGTARFENPHLLIVMDEEYRMLYKINAEKVIICTGSQPRNPENVPFDGSVILDSTTLLNIETVPKSMIVLGGGVIGSEYASFFSTLGTEVTIVDKKDHILPFLDTEIGIHLQTALTDIGLKFLGNKVPESIRRVENLKEGEIIELKKNIRILEGELKDITEDLKALEGKQNQVKKVDEFNALSHEISHLEKKRVAEEARLSEMYDRVSGEESEYTKLKEALDSAQESTNALEIEINEGIERINEEGRSIKEKRDLLVESYDPEVFKIYETLLKNKKDSVVVPIEGRCCSGCHIMVTAQHENMVRRAERLIFCEHCSRIHYWPEAQVVEEELEKPRRRRRAPVKS